MKGIQGTIEVFDNKVVITPKGILGFFNHWLKWAKSIPYSSITGVQFKKSGFTSGYIQFTIPGGNESKWGLFSATKDENTFMFVKDNELALQIKDFIEEKITNKNNSASKFSSADEIEKLYSLMEKGIITKEEFDEKKKNLLDNWL